MSCKNAIKSKFVIKIKNKLKGWNQIYLSIYPLSALLIPLPLIPFTTKEITGCTNEAAKGTNKAGKNLPSCFSFHVLLFQEYHQLIHLNLLITL